MQVDAELTVLYVNDSRDMVQHKKGAKTIRFFIEIGNKRGLNEVEWGECVYD